MADSSATATGKSVWDAVALQQAGKTPEAEKLYREILEQKPDDVSVLNNLGMIVQAKGNSTEALALYHRALASDPENAVLHMNIAGAHRSNGDLEGAIAAYRRSLALRPGESGAVKQLSECLLEQGNVADAFAVYRQAIESAPDGTDNWINLFQALRSHRCARYDDEVERSFVDCFERRELGHQKLAHPAIRFLALLPQFRELFVRAGTNNATWLSDQIRQGSAREILNNRLFCSMLPLVVIPDPLVERVLTGARRALLSWLVEAIESGSPGPKLDLFTVALSNQCFHNEYVFEVAGGEQQQIDALQSRLQSDGIGSPEHAKASLAMLGCYIPLCRIEGIDAILDRPGISEDTRLVDLIDRQVREPLAEKKIIPEIAALTPIEDETSRSVREQYEENPYPRWVNISRVSASTFADRMRGHFAHLSRGDLPAAEAPEILIAGCGTGQHALTTSVQIKNSRVLAIDLSLASLSFGLRKARELGISSVEFLQADILDLDRLGRTFDVIETSGVLHHMEAPLEGWRILVDLLKPDGWMKVGLYSETARRHIVKARDFIEARGYPATASGIRRCRQEILALPESELIRKAALSSDFYSLSQCRDLLFHAKEHRFTLPSIEAALDDLGLEFVGLATGNRELMENYRRRFTDDPTAASLKNWHSYEQENPDTFWGMYQFWTRKRRPL